MYWLPKHICCSTSSGLWRDTAESVARLVDLTYGVSRVSAVGSNDCACIQTYGVWDIFFLLFSIPFTCGEEEKSNGSDGFDPASSAGVPREGIIKSDLFYPSILPDQVLCWPTYPSSKKIFFQKIKGDTATGPPCQVSISTTRCQSWRSRRTRCSALEHAQAHSP